MELNLKAFAFTIGTIKVYWYGIFMALSFLIGAYYLYSRSKQKGIDEDFILNLIIIVILSGIVGARLMFVLTNYPGWFINDPLAVFKVYEGGLSWHGGLLGGLIGGVLYCKSRRVEWNTLADMAVVGMSVGYILVRIGNIFNQEVLGRYTAFSFGRWPAQLVGSFIGVVLLIRYFYLERKHPPDGYQFWSFIFYHQILRAVFEETVRENTLFVWKYVNDYWGVGLFTLTQLATPAILGLAYVMMQRSKAAMRIKV